MNCLVFTLTPLQPKLSVPVYQKTPLEPASRDVMIVTHPQLVAMVSSAAATDVEKSAPQVIVLSNSRI